MRFYIARTENARDLPLPSYMTPGAAGMDLYANVIEDTVIPPGSIHLVPTGIKLALPNGYEAQIRPRSGLALRHGISMVNSPGTIDADFRGEIQVILINHGREDFVVSRGMRIGQMIINKILQVSFVETTEEKLPETDRGAGGFGHTGV